MLDTNFLSFCLVELSYLLKIRYRSTHNSITSLLEPTKCRVFSSRSASSKSTFFSFSNLFSNFCQFSLFFCFSPIINFPCNFYKYLIVLNSYHSKDILLFDLFWFFKICLFLVKTFKSNQTCNVWIVYMITYWFQPTKSFFVVLNKIKFFAKLYECNYQRFMIRIPFK